MGVSFLLGNLILVGIYQKDTDELGAHLSHAKRQVQAGDASSASSVGGCPPRVNLQGFEARGLGEHVEGGKQSVTG